MDVKDKLKIIVAEPWNFSSSDGDNLFYCTIINLNKTDKRELYLARTHSHFEINNNKVDFVILQKRDYQNNNHYNIYIFKDNYDINLFSGDKDIGEKMDFKIIGSVK
jgi:hypothetical protein